MLDDMMLMFETFCTSSKKHAVEHATASAGFKMLNQLNCDAKWQKYDQLLWTSFFTICFNAFDLQIGVSLVHRETLQ